MKTLALAVVSGTILTAAAATPSSAMPALPGLPAVEAGKTVELAGWRCGPHHHWSWYHKRCVPNWRPWRR